MSISVTSGQAEALRGQHQATRLAIALGLRHAVIAPHALLGVAPLLLADEHHRRGLEARDAADDRLVVRVHAVAVQLLELREDERDVVERVRTLRMARELRDLPGRQVREDAARERARLGTQLLDLVRGIEVRVLGEEPQLLDLRLELGDRLFEVQELEWHSVSIEEPTFALSRRDESHPGARAAPTEFPRAFGRPGTLARSARTYSLARGPVRPSRARHASADRARGRAVAGSRSERMSDPLSERRGPAGEVRALGGDGVFSPPAARSRNGCRRGRPGGRDRRRAPGSA